MILGILIIFAALAAVFSLIGMRGTKTYDVIADESDQRRTGDGNDVRRGNRDDLIVGIDRADRRHRR